MKGLLLKDAYTLAKQARLFLIIIVIFSLIPGYSMSAFAVVYAAMMPITALAYDEQAKWDNLAAMMPYTPWQLVMSKYVLGFGGVGAAILLASAAQTVLGLVRHTGPEPEAFLSVLLVGCVGILMLSVNLPFMFKMGVEKGRIVFFVIIGGLTVLGMLGADRLESVLSASTVPLGAVLAAVLAATAAVSVISVCVSVSLYQRRAR